MTLTKMPKTLRMKKHSGEQVTLNQINVTKSGIALYGDDSAEIVKCASDVEEIPERSVTGVANNLTQMNIFKQ